jgi:hypothetical protein
LHADGSTRLAAPLPVRSVQPGTEAPVRAASSRSAAIAANLIASASNAVRTSAGEAVAAMAQYASARASNSAADSSERRGRCVIVCTLRQNG